MDFNLAHQLNLETDRYFQFGALFHKSWLLDYFNCEHFLSLLGDKFIASGEPSFSQECSLHVLVDGIRLKWVVLDQVKILMG